MTPSKPQAIPPAEWVVAGLGLLLTLSLMVHLGLAAFAGPRLPPDISVVVDSIVPQQSGWLVLVTASNAGDQTAADVTLEGAINGDPQRSSVVLDFLPPRSTRSAALLFTADPAGRLTVRATGFR